MNLKFKKIKMSEVREIIAKRGFYYLPLHKIYDAFNGCKYIIVTDNPNFSEQNPKFAKEIIMTPEEFEPYAEIFNSGLANEDRERKRQKLHIDGGYSEDNEADLKILNHDCNPVETAVFSNLQNEKIYIALKQLTEIQRKRVELFYFFGWTERQIADYEGVKRYAVRTSLNAARKKLKKLNPCAKCLSHSLISRRT